MNPVMVANPEWAVIWFEAGAQLQHKQLCTTELFEHPIQLVISEKSRGRTPIAVCTKRFFKFDYGKITVHVYPDAVMIATR